MKGFEWSTRVLIKAWAITIKFLAHPKTSSFVSNMGRVATFQQCHGEILSTELSHGTATYRPLSRDILEDWLARSN